MVKLGKMMWNDTVNANCSRDRKSAVSMGITLRGQGLASLALR
jgi:hypothetical protein